MNTVTYPFWYLFGGPNNPYCEELTLLLWFIYFAAPQLVHDGDINYLVSDYLSEITMSLLTAVKRKSPVSFFIQGNHFEKYHTNRHYYSFEYLERNFIVLCSHVLLDEFFVAFVSDFRVCSWLHSSCHETTHQTNQRERLVSQYTCNIFRVWAMSSFHWKNNRDTICKQDAGTECISPEEKIRGCSLSQS